MVQQVGQLSPDGTWLWNGTQWIPNTPAVVAPPLVSWAKPYESALFRSRFIMVLLLANVAALVVGIVFDAVSLASGGDASGNLAVSLLALAFVVTFYGTFIPCVVLFCMWLHRVVRNMPALGSWDARWSPAGAVGRCFIPFLNLAHPMSGTLDAWRASDPAQRWASWPVRKQMAPPALIVAWWSAWLIGNVLSRISFQMTRSNDPATLASASEVDLASSIVLIAAAVLAVLTIRSVTRRQDIKNELIATGRLA
jgi:Domain of unknown function (DUF4328)